MDNKAKLRESLVITKVVHIEDSYFERFFPQDLRLKYNHHNDDGTTRYRPYLMIESLKRGNIHVCVPLSTKVDRAVRFASMMRAKVNAGMLDFDAPSNWGVSFLMYNEKPNVAYVSNVIPVTKEYIHDVQDALIPAQNLLRIEKDVKDSLRYYHNWKHTRTGYYGVLTKFDEIKKDLQLDKIRETIVKPSEPTVKPSAASQEIKLLNELRQDDELSKIDDIDDYLDIETDGGSEHDEMEITARDDSAPMEEQQPIKTQEKKADKER